MSVFAISSGNISYSAVRLFLFLKERVVVFRWPLTGFRSPVINLNTFGNVVNGSSAQEANVLSFVHHSDSRALICLGDHNDVVVFFKQFGALTRALGGLGLER